MGVPPTNAFDGDNTTAYVSKDAAYPYLQIDMGRSQRVTKVSILASFIFREDPIVNLEVKVGARSVKSPIDDSSPPPSQVLFGNTRCQKQIYCQARVQVQGLSQISKRL